MFLHSIFRSIIIIRVSYMQERSLLWREIRKVAKKGETYLKEIEKYEQQPLYFLQDYPP